MKIATAAIAALLSIYSNHSLAVDCNEVREQYQNYLKCIPLLKEDMIRFKPTEFQVDNEVISLKKAQELSNEIAKNLLGIIQFHKNPAQVISFESRRWVKRTLKKFLEQEYKDLPATNRAPGLIVVGDLNKHGIEVEFHEALSDDQFHVLRICQFRPDEYLASIKSEYALPYLKMSYCLEVFWLKKDFGIYHPSYREFNKFFSYDPDFGMASNALGFKCNPASLKGHHGFSEHNYAFAVTDFDLKPKTFQQFIGGISALRLDRIDDYKFARECK